MACLVDFTEAGAVGAGALVADGCESFILVSSRCMSKESPLIVPAPWMRKLPNPSDAIDDHKIDNK